MTKGAPKKYSNLSVPEALETSKQRIVLYLIQVEVEGESSIHQSMFLVLLNCRE